MKEIETKKEVFNIPANLFRGREAVGGRLIIEDEKIIFKPHSFNFQTEQIEIQTSSIIEVGKRNTLRLVPNGFYVKDIKGEEYKFVVNGRDKVIGYLSKRIGKA